MKPRLKPHEITPEYEDTGLFRAGTHNVAVDLVPVIKHNSRQDILVTGYVGSGREILVTFAGRRKAAATPLLNLLKALRARLPQSANDEDLSLADIPGARMTIYVQGSWRRNVIKDENGWEKYTYQLLAARWKIPDTEGALKEFGKPPRF